MRDTRVHLNNFYICGATNQEINVTPFARMERSEGGIKKMERWKELRKIKQMGCGSRRRRVSRHSSEFPPSFQREGKEKGRESLMNNLCR